MGSYLLIIFIIFILGQLAFTLWLALGLRTTTTSLSSLKSVSVIIAARNEAKNLKALIKSLGEQKHPNFEVIIVNDRSTDHSQELLDAYSDLSWLKVLHIEKTPEQWNGKKYALMEAIKSSKNEVLLFTDGDCVPNNSNWIEKMTEGIDGEIEVNLGFSNYQNSSGMLNQFIQFDTIATALLYLGLANKKAPYMAVGRNWAIARKSYPLELLKAYGHIIGGDDDLIAQEVCHGKNTIVQLDKDSFTSSIPAYDWKSYLSQKTRHLSVGSKYSFKIKTLLAIYPFIHGVIWASLLVLLTTSQWNIALLIFGIRSLSFYIIFRRLGQKLDSNFVSWALPLVEFCYPFWYAFVGIRSLAAKHIEWKAENSFLKKH